jgi:hypothetical protein
LVFNNLNNIFEYYERNRYEGQANGGCMLYNLQLKNRRGAELLDELANVLSNLYSFNSEGDLDFMSTIILLHRYWDDVRDHIDKGNTECRSEFIRILKKMAILHGKTNIPVACAARVIACHVESSYLNDEEARLVQCITGIHIDRAASIINAKTTA